MSHSVAVGLVCADARLHRAEVRITERAAELLGVDDVYLIAKPGPNGVHTKPASHLDALVDDFTLLINAKNPSVLVVMGHQNCAGHPVSNEEHDADASTVAQILKSRTGFAGAVIALVAIYTTDTEWGLKEVARF